MPGQNISIKDILKGILFCVILFLLVYFFNSVIRIGLFETLIFVITKIKSKLILAVILIGAVILGAIISVLSTSIEYGLPLQRLLKKKDNSEKDKNSKNTKPDRSD